MKSSRQNITTEFYKELPQNFFKKSHELIFSRLDLSAREHDMLALFLSRLHKDHWADYQAGKDVLAPQYTFHSDVLKDWFGLSSKQLYPTLRPVAERLSGRKIGLVNDDAEMFDFVPLFGRVTYKSGSLSIVPNAELMTAYLAQSAGHAQINHKSFRALKSEHSKRLYAILSRFKAHNTKLHPQSITQLQGLFGLLDERGQLSKKSYANNKVFIERCIRKPIHEMMQCPEIIAELEFLIDEKSGAYGYKPIQRGKKIIQLEFLFRWIASDNRAEAAYRKKLEEEIVPDNPMLTLAKEAYHVVMAYPVRGELTPHQGLALKTVLEGIILLPDDMPIDSGFRARLDCMGFS
ncbi:RepB family plasmid replication initiator protein [Vibrio parahaemolyticus]|uniref:replication initiation protein n=1 Tax=Vibrio parahaemolyticus TaxID=670 RepID=UPI0011213EDB|nr:replication initiation protein [Vibrio parahaemolyticus]TOM64027.1 RepB family plasmid replication initiator protein [Vibrio parahaemolyticus]TOM64326.1 RepB family plasmid replication initiator protein [Vibrio parahaemolyticus]TOM69290.1 RepB family plasmid replication initiator protein [Vibrio parahaemolyticus]TOO82800.1 RepB family plasmid replication initiator protein [Vibrio parahaemolyticus]